MAKESKAQQSTIARVMGEFKDGTLESSAGTKVQDRKQAVAIALSEAGASNRQTPAENAKRLKRTKQRERSGEVAGQSRASLYAEAAKKGIVGRSRMTKAALQKALGK